MKFPRVGSGELTQTHAATLEGIFQHLVSEHDVDNIGLRTGKTYPDAHDANVQRFLVQTDFWTLIVKSDKKQASIFLSPTVELLNPAQAESLASRKMLVKFGARNKWFVEGSALSIEDLTCICQSIFRDLLLRSAADMVESGDVAYQNLELKALPSFSGSVKRLIADKYTLIEKLAMQQEQMQQQMSNDLHDTVINNLLCLKQSILSGRSTTDILVSLIDEAVENSRDVAYQLAPRDLADLGLLALLGEYIRRFEARTGITCRVQLDAELPSFPHQVQLQIFRIVQEGLNNIEKHSEASALELLSTANASGSWSIELTDDGRGFDATASYSGLGSSILKERTAIIDRFAPAEIRLLSQPDAGCTLRLTIVRPAQGSSSD